MKKPYIVTSFLLFLLGVISLFVSLLDISQKCGEIIDWLIIAFVLLHGVLLFVGKVKKK